MLRWTLRSSELLVALAVVVTVAITVLLANLDKPSVSQSLVDYLREEFNLEVSYETLYASMLSDIVGKKIRVATPEPFARYAPTLLSVGSLEARWDPKSLVGDHITVDTVVIKDLEVALVMDETGRTTFDLLFPEEPSTGTPTPIPSPFVLSRSLEAIPANLKVGNVLVEGVKFTLIELEGGKVARTTVLTGLGLEAGASPGADGRLELNLQLHSPKPDGQTEVVIDGLEEGQPSKQALAIGLGLEVHLLGQKVDIGLDLDLDRQSMVDIPLPKGKLLALQSTVTFQPDAQRTEFSVGKLDLLDGALETDLSGQLLDLPEGGFKTVVQKGAGQIRLEPLLPLAELPASVTVTGGTLGYDIEALELDPATYLPLAGRLKIHGTLQRAAYHDGGMEVSTEGLEPEIFATFKGPMTQDVDLKLPLHGVRYSDKDTLADIRTLTLSIGADTLALNTDTPQASTGKLEAGLDLKNVNGRLSGTRFENGALSMQLASSLTGTPPYALTGGMKVSSLTLKEPRSGTYDLSGTRFNWKLTDADVDPEHLEQAKGRLAADLAVGPLKLDMKVHQKGEAMDYTLDLHADQLAPLAPLLNTFLGPNDQVSWNKMGIDFNSKGTLRGLLGNGAIYIDQKARLDAKRISYKAPDMLFSTPSVGIGLDYRGTPNVGKIDLDLALHGWRYDEMWGDKLLKGRIKVDMHLPRERYLVDLDLSRGDFQYLSGTMKVSVPELAFRLGATYEKGALSGKGGLDTPVIDYLDGTDHVWLKDVVHHLEMSTRGTMEEGELLLAYQADVGTLGQNYAPLYPPSDFRFDTALRIARLSAYSLDRCIIESTGGKTRLELKAAMDDAAGSLAMVAAAETLEASSDGLPDSSGAVPDPGVPITGGESLTVSGVLTQELEALTGDPAFLKGSGKLVFPFRIDSPDQVLYRLTSAPELKNVDLEMPGEPLSISRFNGKVLIVEELRDGPDGFEVLPTAHRNAYARASFPDTHPFLTGDSFFSADRLSYAEFEAAPIAGNLRVDRNMLRLDQLQMGVKKGTITGQLLVDYVLHDTMVLFRGNANGLRLAKDSDERLDSNFALAFSLDKLDLNGQAHIVHVGRKTLLAMLDVFDPYHEDVDFNRVRLGLNAGYPKFVRLKFEHGFMSVKLELGGAAQAIRIDEITGVAIGPVLNTYLGDLL